MSIAAALRYAAKCLITGVLSQVHNSPLETCPGCGAARNEVERCTADPGPPRTVTIPGLHRTTSLCFVLRCARDTLSWPSQAPREPNEFTRRSEPAVCRRAGLVAPWSAAGTDSRWSAADDGDGRPYRSCRAA